MEGEAVQRGILHIESKAWTGFRVSFVRVSY